jgi:hypothetical protein
VLVDHARAQTSQKRGGQAQRISLDEAAIISHERAADVIALDEALKGLAAIDPQQSRIVEPLFWRSELRRDGGSPFPFSRYDQARVGLGEIVAASRNQ